MWFCCSEWICSSDWTKENSSAGPSSAVWRSPTGLRRAAQSWHVYFSAAMCFEVFITFVLVAAVDISVLGVFGSLLFLNSTSARDPPDVTSILQTRGSCARDTELKPWYLRNPRQRICETWTVIAWLRLQEGGCQQMLFLYRYASLNDGDKFWEMRR